MQLISQGIDSPTIPNMSVKIVLRDKESGRYYRGPSELVQNAYDALTFRNILEAEEFCREHSLLGFQIIQQSGYFHRPLRYSRPVPISHEFNKSSAHLS